MEINPAKSIFLYRYLPPERCDVSDDLYVLAHIRYKWLRGQHETVGKSICIHLSHHSSVESANYFSAGLWALLLCSVVKGAQPVQPRMSAEWPMIWTDKGWMTDGERWLRWMTESHTKNEGWNIMLKEAGVQRVGPYLFLWQPSAYSCCIVLASANHGSKSCMFGIPPGQVVIGSASLRWGRDRVDMRIWFAYWVMKEGQRVGGTDIDGCIDR